MNISTTKNQSIILDSASIDEVAQIILNKIINEESSRQSQQPLFNKQALTNEIIRFYNSEEGKQTRNSVRTLAKNLLFLDAARIYKKDEVLKNDLDSIEQIAGNTAKTVLLIVNSREPISELKLSNESILAISDEIANSFLKLSKYTNSLTGISLSHDSGICSFNFDTRKINLFDFFANREQAINIATYEKIANLFKEGIINSYNEAAELERDGKLTRLDRFYSEMVRNIEIPSNAGNTKFSIDFLLNLSNNAYQIVSNDNVYKLMFHPDIESGVKYEMPLEYALGLEPHEMKKISGFKDGICRLITEGKLHMYHALKTSDKDLEKIEKYRIYISSNNNGVSTKDILSAKDEELAILKDANRISTKFNSFYNLKEIKFIFRNLTAESKVTLERAFQLPNNDGKVVPKSRNEFDSILEQSLNLKISSRLR